jgi:hypothetical protein|tara:strand:+ start:467 stop:937 length:471 start_codon:yes stop_codon:yes gene_type:complete
MYKKFLYITSVVLVVFSNAASAEMIWSFKSPAFHYGNGYSSHVLSVEQLQHNRKQDLKDKAEAEAKRLERELENTTLNKFVKNVESRIYATLSKQMVDSMFADCGASCATSGTAEIEGSSISWVKDTTTGAITLTVIEADGSTTTIEIPGTGNFNF